MLRQVTRAARAGAKPTANTSTPPAAPAGSDFSHREIAAVAGLPYPGVRMTMHIARGGFVREFNLFLAIVIEPPGSVRLTRVTDHPTNQEFNATWTLRPAASTRIALELDAKLRVPWYIRAGGIGDAIAEASVGAACRRLSTPSQ